MAKKKKHDDEPELELTPVIGGSIEGPEQRRMVSLDKTFVFTCAQSNTKLHEKFFLSLLSYCKHRDAALHVSRFTYNKATIGKRSVKPGTKKSSDNDGIWFDERIEPYVSDESLLVAPDLVWCGELNILPTRVNPISGFQTYTRQMSAIIPHAKLAMESVPTMKELDPKFVYTTGALTQRNYIQKAAGQKADFHHVFGALVVEVDADGTWWARQVNADSNGEFYDLYHKYTPNGHQATDTVEAVNHGDLHGYKLNMDVVDTMWGQGGVMDKLQPASQYMHDSIDFMPRNHHNMKDPLHFRRMYMMGKESVEGEFALMGHMLATTLSRPYCETYVVVSNHDQAVNTWLSNIAGAMDPVNAVFWHEQNAARLRSADRSDYSPFIATLLTKYLKCGGEPSMLKFLREDDSYRLLGEIEMALHGHIGPNGARGSPRNLRTAGKVNSGHTHSAGIFEGVYTAGVYGGIGPGMDMGYNKGMSSWSRSFIMTYKNAKRAICTIKKGKAWR